MATKDDVLFLMGEDFNVFFDALEDNEEVQNLIESAVEEVSILLKAERRDQTLNLSVCHIHSSALPSPRSSLFVSKNPLENLYVSSTFNFLGSPPAAGVSARGNFWQPASAGYCL